MHPGLVHSPQPASPRPLGTNPLSAHLVRAVSMDITTLTVAGIPAPRRLPARHCPHPGGASRSQRLAATLARAIVEVVTGARQAPQLRRWLLPDLYTALTDIHLSPCARGASAIHVRVCSIDARHTEAAVIVATASRIYALALRLEEYRGRWMATALELA